MGDLDSMRAATRPEGVRSAAAMPAAALPVSVNAGRPGAGGGRRWWRRFLAADEAVSAMEFAILVGIVAVSALAVMTTFSGDVATMTDRITTNVGQSVTTITP